MTLYKILAEHLHNLGYVVTFVTKPVPRILIKNWSGNFSVCYIQEDYTRCSSGIWGMLRVKPSATTTVNNKPVSLMCENWEVIGNIHDPNFLETLVKSVDAALELAQPPEPKTV